MDEERKNSIDKTSSHHVISARSKIGSKTKSISGLCVAVARLLINNIALNYYRTRTYIIMSIGIDVVITIFPLFFFIFFTFSAMRDAPRTSKTFVFDLSA